ncbi:ferredoxin--NADP reductase [Nocardia sp. NPDC050710]|uniref:ferredoxin--NADP reductase n=1 Tax=Nocardia sp. NPDC050710 TaxID=3157220 RepID=UPI0033E05A4C
MNARTHVVKVREVIAETADARTLVLEIPDDLTDRFGYRPGQYLTVRVPSERTGSVARCYSLCSSPHCDARLAVTVKRVPGGFASNLLCDTVVAGDLLTVLGPAGNFGPRRFDADVLLCAGGSGITPIMSIIKSMLGIGRGNIAVLYANRDRNSVIFARQLAELTRRYPRRLRVLQWLESERGLPTARGLAKVLKPYARREWFLCGPTGFVATLESAADALRVSRFRIHREEFRSLDRNPFEGAGSSSRAVTTAVGFGGQVADAVAPVAVVSAASDTTDDSLDSADTPIGAVAVVRVEIDGATHRLDWPTHHRLLDVLLDNGIDAPYVCRESACGSCVCSVKRGRTRMVRNEALIDDELARGLTLACQTLPESARVDIAFDQ